MRHHWLTVRLVTVLVSVAAPPICSAPQGTEAGSWKIQTILYDNPDCDRVAVGDATLLPDDSLIVPLTAWPRTGTRRYEWYEEGDAIELQLISRNRGLSWQTYKGPSLPQKSFKLKNGSLLRVEWKGYEQHPISEQETYEQAGYFIYPIPQKPLFAIGAGFRRLLSRNHGATWTTNEIGLPKRADVAGYGMATARMLRDGTLLMPIFGTRTRRHKVRCASVLRSTDLGETWDLIDVAADNSPAAVAERDIPTGLAEKPPPGVRAFDEAQIIEANKPGRVIAIVEEQFTKELYLGISEDNGKTWTQPKPTGMVGVTPLLRRLHSGTLACAYSNRYSGTPNERGMRLCYSHDDGMTWATNDIVILKDDNARADGQCLWNFIQFSDGTLFASGWATKRYCGVGDEVGYAVGFRFTEKFRTPLRTVRSDRGMTSLSDPKPRDPLAEVKGPWKAEVTIYEHPNAGNAAMDHAVLLADDTIVVPVSVTWRNPFMGYDWYQVSDTLKLNLISRDRGISWQLHQGAVPKQSFRTKDGVLVSIHWLGYQQHPMEKLSEYEQAGQWIYMIPEKKLFAITGPFQVETSSDKGRTWRARAIQLPPRAFLAGYGMHTARMLSDGTILMPAFGYLSRRHKTYACSMLRSADHGKTWDLVTIAQDESPEATAQSDLPSGSIWAQFRGIKSFDECSVVETNPGGVLAIIEESWSKQLYSCTSKDGGKTWTRPTPTGMVGVAPQLLRLTSGVLGCAYSNRYAGAPVERGMRVCYSNDNGKTWDTKNVVVLKDDNARPDGQGLWNFFQFSDRTLFACGVATKRGCGGGHEIGFATGFRFTEEYRTPLR